MSTPQTIDWLRTLTPEVLQRCAEAEGGRARLAIDGYANAHTAAYFAREAAMYAAALLDRGKD